MKVIKILYVLFLSIIPLKMVAQQSVNASGKSVSNTYGSLSYSVGQIAYTSNSSATGTISQGVQQPFEIYTLSVENFSNINLNFQIYPNPTVTFLTLKTENMTFDSLEYQLFDLSGKKILDSKVTQKETNISFESLSASIYFLKVSNKDKVVKSFKIIKTN